MADDSTRPEDHDRAEAAAPPDAPEPCAHPRVDGMMGIREAEEIADRMRRLAGSIARQQAQFLTLLDEIDRTESWTHWIGVRTLVQWVAFVCEMDAHTAREHIRVMRGLRAMPQVAQQLADSRISFSKAREITRLAGRIDDEEAAGITRRATASQISAMVAAYRRLDPADTDELLDSLVGRVPQGVAEVAVPEAVDAPGSDGDGSAEGGAVVPVKLPAHLAQDSLHLSTQQFGRARLILDLPEADALELLAALDGIRDALNAREESSEESRTTAGGDSANRVDALLELVRMHRDGTPPGSPVSASRATVVVHVSPEALAAGSGAPVEADARRTPRAERCHTADRGPITAASAARLACGGTLVGALIDASGDVLALGRSRRLASHRQRLALSARDLHCQFPTCARRTRLEAHHIRMWSEGGATDLDNMLLLCRSHHIAVHENHLRITREEAPVFSGALRAGTGFAFHTEAGVRIRPGDAEDLAPTDGTVTRSVTLGIPRAVLGPHEPDIVTEGGGWGFTLDAGIAWLFDAEAARREHLLRHAADQEEAPEETPEGASEPPAEDDRG